MRGIESYTEMQDLALDIVMEEYSYKIEAYGRQSRQRIALMDFKYSLMQV